MCEAAAKAVQLQCRREYGFSNESDVRTTVPSTLESKYPNIQFDFRERFCKLNGLAKVAKSRNYKFKGCLCYIFASLFFMSER